MGDPRELFGRALAGAAAVVAQAGDGTLDRATPCGHWSVGAVIRHLTAHNRGFAAAARGGRPEPGVWHGDDLTGDPREEFAASAAEVAEAFAADPVPGRRIELAGLGAFDVPVAVAIHAVDCLVHGWDLAAGLGVPYRPADGVVAGALAVAERWPATPAVNGGPGAPFGARVEVPADAPPLHRVLAVTGRRADWTPPASG